MKQTNSNLHPCVKCGACCAFFRVAFYWRETEGVMTEKSNWKVPIDKTVDLDDFYKCMKGTEKKHNPKCNSLKGEIGKFAICTMYESRPTPCRAFCASFENGKSNQRCDQARLKHGLKPLTREDWYKYHQHSIPITFS